MKPESYDEHVWAWRQYNLHLRGFYAWLVEGQQPLGKEFEIILHENIWDLYAR